MSESSRDHIAVRGRAFTFVELPAVSRRKRAAFTLVELLVVIGIIAVLISVLMPALSKARAQALITKSTANMKQLSTAWVLYANDNRGALPYAETTPADWTNPDPKLRHADGWVIDVPGDPTSGTEAAVRQGAIWKYAPAPETYRIPASSDEEIYRGYSITTHMNGTNEGAFAFIPKVTKLSQVKPDRLVFIEEYDIRVDPVTGRRINQGSFFQFKSLDNRWGDTVALFNAKGTVMGFGDTHIEYRKWKDPRTLNAVAGQLPPVNNTLNAELRQLKIDYYGVKLLFGE